jgi:O-antigen ligase
MTEHTSNPLGIFLSRNYSATEKLAAGLLLAYPAAMLLLHGGMNGVFLLMLLLALGVGGMRRATAAQPWQRDWILYAAAMASLSLAILLTQAYHGRFASHPHDAASRYWLAVPIFLLLQGLRPAIFGVLQLAFPVAAILGLALAHDSGVDAVAVRLTVSTLDPIHYGDFELMLGVLSLASLGWFGRDSLALRMLKVAGFAAGLAASFASGSRGGWLAIPFLAMFPFAFRLVRPSAKVMAAGIAALLLGTALLYSFSTTFHARLQRLPGEFAAFRAGERDTATGVRLQLYAAATDVFLHHPLFGVGPEGFAQELQPMVDAGKVTPFAAQLGRAEVHNDLLSKAVGMGIFGLLAMLAIYLVPLRLFLRTRTAPRREARQAGMLGAMFVSGFLVFGLTVETLNLAMAAAFYGFTVAVLLGACLNAHYRVANGTEA